MATRKNSNRNVPAVASLLLAGSLALTLAACGSSDSATSEGSSAATDSVAAETAPVTQEADDAVTADADATEAADDDSAGSSDAGSAGEATPAPEGVMISAIDGRDLPEQVGDYTNTGKNGPADMYKLNEEDGVFDAIGVEARAGMDYAGAIERLNDTVPGGTGLCGTTSGGDDPLCYLQATDGTVVVTAYSSFISLEGLAAFCNELAVQLGTE